MPELVSDNDFVHGTLDAEYIIVPSNSKLTGKIVYSEASEIIKKVDEQEKTYKREVIRGVDLSEHGKEILIQIRMFQ